MNIFAFRPDLNLGGADQALESKNLVQILAEPNLVTANNNEASFVVGGEFPVPVLQGGANSGAVTIQFREFGVRLTFTPIITGNNTIRLHVKPEVSDLDYGHAVTFNGFTIPALATKKMETTIELGEGQSFVIAGLLDNRVTDSWSKIPGIGNIPVIGDAVQEPQPQPDQQRVDRHRHAGIHHPARARRSQTDHCHAHRFSAANWMRSPRTPTRRKASLTEAA